MIISMFFQLLYPLIQDDKKCCNVSKPGSCCRGVLLIKKSNSNRPEIDREMSARLKQKLINNDAGFTNPTTVGCGVI